VTSEDKLREQALSKLKRRQDFWHHVVVYVIVNAFLIGIWYFASGAGYFWPGWVLLGWGIGLAFHAWDVYGRRDITEAEVQKEIERQRQRGDVPDDEPPSD